MTWIATHDANGRKCWMHNTTGQMAYRTFGGATPVSSTMSPTMSPSVTPQSPMLSPLVVPVVMQSPSMYPYHGSIPGGVPPLNLNSECALRAGPAGYAWVNTKPSYESYGSYGLQ